MGRDVLMICVKKFAVGPVSEHFHWMKSGCPTDQPIVMIDPPRDSTVRARHFGPKKIEIG